MRNCSIKGYNLASNLSSWSRIEIDLSNDRRLSEQTCGVIHGMVHLLFDFFPEILHVFVM